MRIWLWFIGGGILALICVWALAHVLPSDLALIATALLIMTTGLGAYLVNAGEYGVGIACLGVKVLGVAWFWIRYRRLRAQA